MRTASLFVWAAHYSGALLDRVIVTDEEGFASRVMTRAALVRAMVLESTAAATICLGLGLDSPSTPIRGVFVRGHVFLRVGEEPAERDDLGALPDLDGCPEPIRSEALTAVRSSVMRRPARHR